MWPSGKQEPRGAASRCDCCQSRLYSLLCKSSKQWEAGEKKEEEEKEFEIRRGGVVSLKYASYVAQAGGHPSFSWQAVRAVGGKKQRLDSERRLVMC